MNSFWKDILSSKSTNSSKRLVTLVISAHFIITVFVILYLVSYMIFFTPKGKVDTNLLDLLKSVLDKEFWIIMLGLTYITGEQFVRLKTAQFQSLANGSNKSEQNSTPPSEDSPICSQ